ncbi:hypothetical protein J6590_104300 [Homalodisca vitripennis]|nr:hypothetical protein J6590_104300 [Homalodisca vitripennis]
MLAFTSLLKDALFVCTVGLPLDLAFLQPLFCPSTGICDDLIKQNKAESRYITRLIVLIKSAMVTGRI